MVIPLGMRVYTGYINYEVTVGDSGLFLLCSLSEDRYYLLYLLILHRRSRLILFQSMPDNSSMNIRLSLTEKTSQKRIQNKPRDL